MAIAPYKVLGYITQNTEVTKKEMLNGSERKGGLKRMAGEGRGEGETECLNNSLDVFLESAVQSVKMVLNRQ